MGNIWRVYDDREMEYLNANGFRYEIICRDLRSKQKMFIYLNSKDLQETINKFKSEVLRR